MSYFTLIKLSIELISFLRIVFKPFQSKAFLSEKKATVCGIAEKFTSMPQFKY